MYLKYLSYFITVAEYRNFSKAAEKLNTVQPSISRQIKRLEEIVGTPLFIRNPHELELTKPGEIFLEHAKSILRQFEQAKAQALEAAMTESHKINIGTISGTEQPLFERVLIPAKNKHPYLSFNLMSRNEVELVSNVKDGTLDMAFLMGSNHDESLNCHKVCTQTVVVAMSHANPLASKEKVTVEDLKHLSLYLPKGEDSPFYKSVINPLLLCIGADTQNSNVNCDCAMSAMQSVSLDNNGACFVSDFQVYFAPNHVVFKEIDNTGLNFCLNHDLVLISSKKNTSKSIDSIINQIH